MSPNDKTHDLAELLIAFDKGRAVLEQYMRDVKPVIIETEVFAFDMERLKDGDSRDPALLSVFKRIWQRTPSKGDGERAFKCFVHFLRAQLVELRKSVDLPLVHDVKIAESNPEASVILRSRWRLEQ